MYLIELRKDTNEVVAGFKDSAMKDKLTATKINWISGGQPVEKFECSANIRSSQTPQKVTVTPLENGDIEVEFENMQKTVAVGQSVVLYNDDIVLGGGIIDKV